MKQRWAIGVGAAVIAIGLTVVFAGPAAGIVIDGFFIDDNNSPFEDDIDAIAEAGITRGCDSAGTRFCPDSHITRGEMAAFLRRALGLPISAKNWFTDDDNSLFEDDINAIADAGITRGCDPQATNLFCPAANVTRGEMAAFLRRAQSLPVSATNWFTDDDNSLFEDDINAIADAGITKGCSLQPTPTYCPLGAVTRGEMAAFLRRSLALPSSVIQISIGDQPALNCSGTGETCSLTVDVDAQRPYLIREGLFQVLPATVEETAELNGSGTRFTLTLDGSGQELVSLPVSEEGNFAFRRWEHPFSFTAGTYTLVGTWYWASLQIQKTTVTIRAG